MWQESQLRLFAVQYMANMLTSAHSVLPYGMLLTIIFRACDLNLDGQTDIRVTKPYDAIDNAYISRLSYEHNGCEWVEKVAHTSTVVEEDTDEEAEMDIPPPSPTGAPSPSTPPTVGAGSSAAPPDWYQNLPQRLDTLSLDIQELRQYHQDDIHILSEEQDRRFHTLSEEQDR